MAESSRNIAVRVTAVAERALRAGHPWLFDGAITSISHEGAAGDRAIIFDRKRRFLAAGLYDPTSPIRVKVFVHDQPQAIDAELFYNRLAQALALRQPLIDDVGTTGYRCVNGENDGLPALIIDHYANIDVFKLYSPLWLPHLDALVDAWLQLKSPERIVLRLARRVDGGAFALHDGQVIYGPALAEQVLFTENRLTFEAAVVSGNKTGFFLDQRDNRTRVRQLASGRSVLDIFCSSGGFTVSAACGGARRVDSVDISRQALAAAAVNMQRNQFCAAATEHQTWAGDAFEIVQQFADANRRFDLIVIDPPSFAQRQSAVPNALRAYARLTRLGLALLQPNGILVQASCSSRVSGAAFYDCVLEAAWAVGRPLQEIARTGHPLDHPITFAEGAYLKCLFARG